MANLRYEMKQACLGGPFVDGGGKQIQDKDTARTYRRAINGFCDWLKDEHHINNRRQLDAGGGAAALVQAYADTLQCAGKSASTIHTYLAPVCKGLGIHLGDIKKPSRSAGSITKSRDGGNRQGAVEARQDKNSRLVQFQEMAGLRRSELKRLTAASIRKDESGHYCILVENGKGGKSQLQRILPEDTENILVFYRKAMEAAAAAGVLGSTVLLFTKKEMANKIDLHGIRAEHARKAYAYYLVCCQSQQGKAALQKELVDRWNACHGEKDRIIGSTDGYQGVSAKSRKYIEAFSRKGQYFLRGENKVRCLRDGWPIAYDRTALLAVSVFHLAHWRNDVTVKHYML